MAKKSRICSEVQRGKPENKPSVTTAWIQNRKTKYDGAYNIAAELDRGIAFMVQRFKKTNSKK